MMAKKRQKKMITEAEIETALNQIAAEQKASTTVQKRKREGEQRVKTETEKMLEAINFIGDYLASFPTPKRTAAR